MTTIIPGQLDALDLLAPPKPPANPHASYQMVNPCPACGEESPNEFMAELNHWGMPNERHKFGHDVCASMSLKLNHVHHALARAGNKWEEGATCCWSKTDLHGKAIKKPNREHWLDHARHELTATTKLWALHLDSLIREVSALRKTYGVKPSECPIVEEE